MMIKAYTTIILSITSQYKQNIAVGIKCLRNKVMGGNLLASRP